MSTLAQTAVTQAERDRAEHLISSARPDRRHCSAASALLSLTPVTDESVRLILEAAFRT